MNIEIVEKYLESRYGNSSLDEKKDHYKLDNLFLYETSNKELIWYVDVESDLYSWFGPGNYDEIIHSWFFKRFGKEIGYDK
jgi:hypothetical protein